jgi:hypothetical protein
VDTFAQEQLNKSSIFPPICGMTLSLEQALQQALEAQAAPWPGGVQWTLQRKHKDLVRDGVRAWLTHAGVVVADMPQTTDTRCSLLSFAAPIPLQPLDAAWLSLVTRLYQQRIADHLAQEQPHLLSLDCHTELDLQTHQVNIELRFCWQPSVGLS